MIADDGDKKWRIKGKYQRSVNNKYLFVFFQALQSKHDALLKRVDELDTECEQLREHVIEAEGEKDELKGVTKDLEAEKNKLSVELESKQVGTLST